MTWMLPRGVENLPPKFAMESRTSPVRRRGLAPRPRILRLAPPDVLVASVVGTGLLPEAANHEEEKADDADEKAQGGSPAVSVEDAHTTPDEARQACESPDHLHEHDGAPRLDLDRSSHGAHLRAVAVWVAHNRDRSAPDPRSRGHSQGKWSAPLNRA